MKRIITLLAVALTANFAISQTAVFQSDLSSWAAGDPTDWMGTRTNINATDVTEQTLGASFGTSMASLLNATSSHKRFTTNGPTFVVGGTDYIFTAWVAASAGEIRFNYYDNTASNYGTYTPYQDLATLSGGNLVMITDTVTIPMGSNSAEFIISIRNTSSIGGIGIVVDSVVVTGMVGTPPPPPTYVAKTIFEIQNTTLFSGDSPLKDTFVETTGIVTGISTDTRVDGYFIQDSASAWNGIFVSDGNNVPSRGDMVTVRGQVKENFDNTEIMSVDTMIIVSSGNPEPMPISLTSATASSEMYEGVLLKVSAAMCVDTVVRFGEWFIAGAGIDTLMVDDLMLSSAFNPVLYQGYDVTGVLYYAFNNFKIEPRDSVDIVQNLTISLNELDKNLQFTVYPNPVNEMFTISGINLERADIYSATGKLVKSVSLNTINTIDVSELSNGVYVVRVISGNNAGVSRFVKQ